MALGLSYGMSDVFDANNFSIPDFRGFKDQIQRIIDAVNSFQTQAYRDLGHPQTLHKLSRFD